MIPMLDRRTARGSRRPVVVDLLLFVAVASFVMTAVRATLAVNLDPSLWPMAILSLAGIPVIAGLYGAASAIEMRQGWAGSSALAGILHAMLVVGSIAGIMLLAVVSPTAACMTIAAEGLLLLWSSSWL
jgi:hypothetical protein